METKSTATSTEAAVLDILTSTTDMICPALFQRFYGRATVGAAFRVAKSRGLIEVNYIGGTGTPVYKLTAAARALVAVEKVTA